MIAATGFSGMPVSPSPKNEVIELKRFESCFVYAACHGCREIRKRKKRARPQGTYRRSFFAPQFISKIARAGSVMDNHIPAGVYGVMLIQAAVDAYDRAGLHFVARSLAPRRSLFCSGPAVANFFRFNRPLFEIFFRC